MEFSEFKQKIRTSIPIGTILDNPGGGTSTILSCSSEAMSYRRRNSTIYVSLRDLFDGYVRFKGGSMSSNDLKVINPSVFDSNARPAGHSCNCTFLFMVLQKIGVVTHIQGHGVRGDPFFVVLKE